ncbi:MAG: sigma-70 family RNA polymerase sigma factor [Christensenellaceae bacterium]|nr:sigma-70 family RNA polymerase sigma factor [Christensenellaceae bacterium]
MDEQEFERAIRRLQTRMYRTAVSILWNDEDAADAIQEAILRAWRKRHTLREPAAFDMWLMRILLNECRNIQRRNRFRTLPLEESLLSAVAEPPDTGLQDALRRLPEKRRIPLLLHCMDGYTVPEVARMMRLPESTVRGRIHEGRKQLKTLLKEMES